MVGRLIAAAHAGVSQANVARFRGGPARARR
jgi:hypothetical protein